MTMDNLSRFLILLTIISHVASEFTCPRNGRILNPQDPTYRTYYYCKQLRSGDFVKLLYKCPGTTLFNPSEEICSADYKPEQITTTTTLSDEPFKCTARGRFADPSDETCRRYYLCSAMRDGTFVKGLYICPNNSHFDPSLKMCSDDYRCATNTKADEASTKSTFETSSGSTLNAIEFVCDKKGRFSDPNDNTCTVYYLCSQLKNGDFVKTKYKCPSGSCFDPDSHRCTNDYVCNLTTLKGETTAVTQNNDSDGNTITVPTTTNGVQNNSTTTINENTKFTFNGEITSSLNGFETTSTTSSSILLNTTLENNKSTTDEDENLPESEFTCTEKGRFADPQDSTCKNYFLCSKLRNGTFIKTKYQCPKNSRFDPGSHVCSTSYICSGSTKKPCRAPRTQAFTCTQKGRHRDPYDNTCQLYYLCTLLHNGTFISTQYRCPEGSYFDPELGKCSAVYVCSGVATPPADVGDCEGSGDDDDSEEARGSTAVFTDGDQDGQSGGVGGTTEGNTPGWGGDVFVCGEEGRFADLNDPNCEDYFLCSEWHDGSFIRKKYKCPGGSYFDPELHVCSVSYKCQRTTTIGTSTNINSNTSEGITQASTIKGGLSSIPMDTEEDSYSDFTSTLSGEDYSSYDSTEDSSDYNSSPELFKTTSNEDFSSLITNSDSILSFEVTSSAGLFKTTSNENGNTEKEATKDYADFDSSSSTYDDSSFETSAEFFTPKEISTSTKLDDYEDITSEELSSEAVTSFHTDEVTKATPPGGFSCSAKGRFPDPTDASCTTYYLCAQWRNGTFSSWQFKCPDGTFFNPSAQTCSTNYQCPYRTESSDFDSTSWESSEEYDYNYTEEEGGDDSTYFTVGESGMTDSDEDSSVLTTRLDQSKPVDDFNKTTESLTEETFNTLSTKIDDFTTISNSTFDTSEGDFNKLSTKPDDFIKTTILPSKSTTNSFSSTTQQNTDPPAVSFECKERGRYPNPNDRTCSSYYLCSKLRNGTFISTIYTCPSGAYFNPAKQSCSSEYQCPSLSTTPEENEEGTLLTTRLGFSETSTSKEENGSSGNTALTEKASTDGKETKSDDDSTAVFEKATSGIDDSARTTDSTSKNDGDLTLTTVFESPSTEDDKADSSLIPKTDDDSLQTTLFEQTSTENNSKKTEGVSLIPEASTEADGSSQTNHPSSTSGVETETKNTVPLEEYSKYENTTVSIEEKTESTEVTIPTKNTVVTIPLEEEETKISEITVPFEGGTENTDVTNSFDDETKNTDVTITIEGETTKTIKDTPPFEEETKTTESEDGTERTKETVPAEIKNTETVDETKTTKETVPVEEQTKNTETADETKTTKETVLVEEQTKTTEIEDATKITEETVPLEEETKNTDVTIPLEDETKITETTAPFDENTEKESTLISVTIFNNTNEEIEITTINPSTQESTNYSITINSSGKSTFSSTELPKTTNTDLLHGHTIGTINACKARGYYKNYDDQSGVSYFYCDIASDGRLFQYLLQCPHGYFYNDENHLCTPVEDYFLT